jgi:uncharacterized membrane protein YeaQ/YmgE (transglycosylase-associated protein family)
VYLLLWILVGLLAGWLAGRSLEGNGYGPSMDIAMGIGGAVAGGLWMQSSALPVYVEAILTTLVAMSCAVLLTIFTGLANGRRLYSRPLWRSSGRSNYLTSLPAHLLSAAARARAQ